LTGPRLFSLRNEAVNGYFRKQTTSSLKQKPPDNSTALNAMHRPQGQTTKFAVKDSLNLESSRIRSRPSFPNRHFNNEQTWRCPANQRIAGQEFRVSQPCLQRFGFDPFGSPPGNKPCHPLVTGRSCPSQKCAAEPTSRLRQMIGKILTRRLHENLCCCSCCQECRVCSFFKLARRDCVPSVQKTQRESQRTEKSENRVQSSRDRIAEE
jgi:hypothetical protein